MLYKGKEPVRNLQYMGKEVQTLYKGDKLVYAWHENKGENITAEYSGEYPTKSLVVYGKSEVVDGQFKDIGTAKVVHGKNLLNENALFTSMLEKVSGAKREVVDGVDGITFKTVNAHKTGALLTINVIPNNTYVCRIHATLVLGGKLFLVILDENDDNIVSASTSESSYITCSFKPATNIVKIKLSYETGGNWHLDANSCQLELGSTPTEYEPYWEKTVYEVEVKSTGKNLINSINVVNKGFLSKITNINGMITIESNPSDPSLGTSYKNGYFTIKTPLLKKQTSYTLSFDVEILDDSHKTAGRMVVLRNGNTIIDDYDCVSGFKKMVMFSPSEDVTTLEFHTSGLNAVFKNFIIAPTSSYAYSTTTLQLDQPLRGIPVTDPALATYTDENGQMWCADDSLGNVRVVALVFDGTESFVKNPYITTTSAFYPSSITNYKSNQPVLCTHFAYTNNVNDTSGHIYLGQGLNILTDFNTTSEFKQYLTEQYKKGTPVIVYYIAATPTTTEIEQPNLNQLTTYDDKTSISNDQNAHMRVQYYLDTNINPWGMLSLRIQRGQLPPIGTQYTTTSAYGNITWDVVAHDYLTPEGKKHSIMLLTHDVITNLQFDAQEAIYYAENGLTAGTYNITLGGNYDTTYGGGKTYTFTLAKDVPKGGQLVLTWQYRMLPTKIASYKDSNTTSAIESVNVTEGFDGTALGTSAVKKADCSANFNCIHRIRYGSNNYKESALRQWLNSDGAKGAVWTPQTKYDRPPAWKTNSVGWLNGLQSDFLSVVQPIDVPCITNSIYEENQSLSTAYTVKDRFFLASHIEVGLSANPTLGALLPYYEGKTNADKIKNNGANPHYWWLRTPYPSYGNNYRNVNRSGSLSDNSARNTNGAVADYEKNVV